LFLSDYLLFGLALNIRDGEPLTSHELERGVPMTDDVLVSDAADATSQKGRSEFSLQMLGYGLTTARILYRMPDHPKLIQEFLWQTYDLAPDFPRLYRFIDYWKREIEGPLHSVEYAHRRLVGPNEWENLDGVFQLN
jgi:uncharacterized protein Usg